MKLFRRRKRVKTRKRSQAKASRPKAKLKIRRRPAPKPAKPRRARRVRKEKVKLGLVWMKKDHERPFVETVADNLYRLVEERKKVTIPEAARFLGIGEDRVEDLCRMLGEHKLVEVHYPAFGKPVILSTKYVKQTKKGKAKNNYGKEEGG